METLEATVEVQTAAGEEPCRVPSGCSPPSSAVPALVVFPASLGPRAGAALWVAVLDAPETQVLPPRSAFVARLAGRSG